MFLPTRSIVPCSAMCRTKSDDCCLNYSIWLRKQMCAETSNPVEENNQWLEILLVDSLE
jgi:hypothetical protein